MRKDPIGPVIKELRRMAKEEGILRLLEPNRRVKAERTLNDRNYFEGVENDLSEALDAVAKGVEHNRFVLLRLPSQNGEGKLFRRVDVKHSFRKTSTGDDSSSPAKKVVLKIVDPYKDLTP